MSTLNPRQLSRQSAERALDGTGRSGAPSVDVLLRVAKAPASSFELNSEADAVAMFRATRTAAAADSAGPGVLALLRGRGRRARLVLAGAAAAILASTSVALAATGNLPGPLGGGNGHHRSAPTAQVRPEGSPTAQGTSGATLSLRALCRAFQARAEHGGKPLADPTFKRLVRRAGSAEAVPAYCASVVTAPAAKPTSATNHAPGSAGSNDPTQGTSPDAPTTTADPGDGDTNAPQPASASPTHKPHPTHPAHPSKSPEKGNGADG
ncbi:MAG: hypothetical protein ACJ72E_14480 [Marmoricola sp.]